MGTLGLVSTCRSNWFHILATGECSLICEQKVERQEARKNWLGVLAYKHSSIVYMVKVRGLKKLMFCAYLYTQLSLGCLCGEEPVPEAPSSNFFAAFLVLLRPWLDGKSSVYTQAKIWNYWSGMYAIFGAFVWAALESRVFPCLPLSLTRS